MNAPISPDELKRKFPAASPGVRREVERQWAAWQASSGAAPVAGRAPKDAKRDQRSECKDKRVEEDEACMGYRIEFVAFRRRLADSHDNFRFSLKPVVDFITAWLGFATDEHRRLSWCYNQVKSNGRQGVAIKVERYKLPK